MNRITRRALLCASLATLAGCGGGGGGPAQPLVGVPRTPTQPTPVGMATISVGGNHTCANSSDYAVYCWGDNSFGQLGIGNTTSASAPGLWVPGLDDGVDGAFPAFAGARHSCARGYALGSRGYFLLCWGDNSSGQLGNGTTANSTLPSRVASAANGDVIDSLFVSPGGSHTCGFSGNRAYCWGANGAGQLGNGMTLNSAAPVAVGGDLSFNMTTLSAGAEHTCGVTTAGAAYCWGSNTAGQLGDGKTLSSAVPVAVAGGLIFSMVSAGDGYTCGVTTARAAYCWGANGSGQLGNGTTTPSAIPVAVSGGHVFAMVAAANNHACGLTSAGIVYCWGANSSGQLGDGTMTASSTPKPVMDLVLGALGAGGSHSCALTIAGVAYCWGDNHWGQLGNGTTTNSSVPVKVAGQP